jgi:hypothetical protein
MLNMPVLWSPFRDGRVAWLWKTHQPCPAFSPVMCVHKAQQPAGQLAPGGRTLAIWPQMADAS